MFYYIVPAVVEYVKDEGGNLTTEIQSVYPSVIPKGKWVADCKDNETYLIKTNTEIASLQPISEDILDEVVSDIGFNPSLVRNWGF